MRRKSRKPKVCGRIAAFRCISIDLERLGVRIPLSPPEFSPPPSCPYQAMPGSKFGRSSRSCHAGSNRAQPICKGLQGLEGGAALKPCITDTAELRLRQWNHRTVLRVSRRHLRGDGDPRSGGDQRKNGPKVICFEDRGHVCSVALAGG